MAKAKKDWIDRVVDLHAVLEPWSSATEGERDNARRALDRLLGRHGKTWNDIPELLATAQQRERERRARSASSQPPGAPPPPTAPLSGADLFHGMMGVLRLFVSLEPDDYVAVTLWAMATHVARRFMHTARLILRSGVRDCGKTTCLDVLNGVVAYPQKSDNMTAASFCPPDRSGRRHLGGDVADRRGR